MQRLAKESYFDRLVCSLIRVIRSRFLATSLRCSRRIISRSAPYCAIVGCFLAAEYLSKSSYEQPISFLTASASPTKQTAIVIMRELVAIIRELVFGSFDGVRSRRSSRDTPYALCVNVTRSLASVPQRCFLAALTTDDRERPIAFIYAD
jgi:hypothetical protein